MPKELESMQTQEFVHKEVLPNGLRVLVHEMPFTHTVSARLFIRAGSRFENESNAGCAHFLEHLCFDGGSKNYPGIQELEKAIEAMGGYSNGETNEEYTSFETMLPIEHADQAIAFLYEIVFNPLLSDDAITNQRAVIAQELKRSKDDPDDEVWSLLKRHVWKGHPAGHEILGTFKTIDALTRKDLLDYYNHFYKPNNSILVVAGNIQSSRVLDLVKSNFGQLEPDDNLIFNPIQPQHILKPRLIIRERDIEQSHILLAFPTKGLGQTTPLLPQIYVLSKMMDRNIYYKFRDLGLSYEAYCDEFLLSDNGHIGIQAGIEPKNTEEAIETIVKEVSELTINEESLQRAKTNVISTYELNLADSDDYTDFIGIQEFFYGRVGSLDEIKNVINNVKLEEVQYLKDNLINENNCALVIFGPVSKHKARKFDRSLSFK